MNKKNNNLVYSYLISFAFMFFSYWLLGNITIGVINGLLYFYVLYIGVFKTYQLVVEKIKIHEKFRQFSNSLIMQLTVTPNINDAFKQIVNISNEEYNYIFLDDSLLVEEKLDSLESYFPIPLFSIMKHILLLYIEQGGNILDMSQELLNKCDTEVSNMQEIFLLNKQKWSESIIMWLFSLFAFVYLRSSLISYYLTLMQNTGFIICIEAFLLIFIISLNVSSKKYLKEQIEI